MKPENQKTKLKIKTEVLLLVAVTLMSALLIIPEIPPVKADDITDAINLGLDWLDRMTYEELNSTHAVALESPSLSFRLERSDGKWTIFGKKDNLNMPPSATMIEGGALSPEATSDDLGLIASYVDRQRCKYKFDLDEDDDYNDVIIYVEYATTDNTHTTVAGKVVGWVNKGVTIDLWLEETELATNIGLNSQFSINNEWGWAGRRYTIRPTTKGLADLYVWLATSQFSWLDGQTYQQTRGVNYTDRALKLYRTWYGSGYVLDRFDGHYGATTTTRPWAGQFGIPNYPANPDLIWEPLNCIPPYGDLDPYIDNNDRDAGWYSYSNKPANPLSDGKVLRFATCSRSIMPDDKEWDNCPFQCSTTEFAYAYKSRTGFDYARNQYIANGFEYDLINYNGVSQIIVPGADVVLGIGTDAKSIRACHDMSKYGANVPYGLSTLKTEFIDSAQWDGYGIARDSWHGTPIGWAYPAYGTHNTATYGNAVIQYYKLTSDESYAKRADEVVGVLLMLQNKLGTSTYSRSKETSFYRAEFVGSFLPGYAVAYSFGQQDIYSAQWVDVIYGILQATGVFECDPQPTTFPCMGNAECTIPSVWTLIQYKTLGRTPKNPTQPLFTMPFRGDTVAYTDHGGTNGGDGLTTIVSPNVTSTHVSGNKYRHVGQLDRLRMASWAGIWYGWGWTSIEYEWNFTISNPAPNWRAKVYFTIPDWAGFAEIGSNAMTCTVALYNSLGQTVASESKTPLDDITGCTAYSGGMLGKMFVYNDLAKVSNLAAGTYTVKLGFLVEVSGNINGFLNTGYINGNHLPGLPMGLESFGWDTGWTDNFDDNMMDSAKWQKVETATGLAAEGSNKLYASVIREAGWGEAGYVTRYTQQMNGFTASVNVANIGTGEETILQICTTKVTSSDPHNENNWYRILKNRWDSNVYIQRRVNGVKTYLTTTSWVASTGQLQISVVNGMISFYENGILRYSEPYALYTYNVYVYVVASMSHIGYSYFDDFAISPTINFNDEFNVPYYPGWSCQQGSWLIYQGMLLSMEDSSVIRTNQEFSYSRHIRARVCTDTPGSSTRNVAWVVAKDAGSDHQIYGLIRTDGTVELSLTHNGQWINWTASSALIPTVEHVFDISVMGTRALMWIDGTLYHDVTHDWIDDFGGTCGFTVAGDAYGYIEYASVQDQ